MTKSRFPKPLSGRPLPDELMEPFPPIPRELVEALAFGETEGVRQAATKRTKDLANKWWKERLLILHRHYGIDVGNALAPYQLLEALLKDFIIGFNIARTIGAHKSGKRKGSHKLNRFELYLAVKKLTANGKLSALEACKKLGRKSGPWFGASATALEKHYRRFLRELKDYQEGRGPDPVQSDISELARRTTKSKYL